MKILSFLLLSLGVCAQSIQKKDGSTLDISGGQIHVEADNKRLVYFLKDSKKAQYVKFKELEAATWNDFRFRMFEVGGKRLAFYVIGESGGKTLVASKRMRIKSRGGFESTYVRYEVAVLQSGNAIESLSFTDENSDKKANERGNVIPMILKNFPDCQPLVDKAKAFESTGSDTKNSTILVLLNDPIYVECK